MKGIIEEFIKILSEEIDRDYKNRIITHNQYVNLTSEIYKISQRSRRITSENDAEGIIDSLNTFREIYMIMR